MDHVSMGTRHYNKRIKSTKNHAITGELYTGWFPTYFFIRHIGGVVQDVRQVCRADIVAFNKPAITIIA